MSGGKLEQRNTCDEWKQTESPRKLKQTEHDCDKYSNKNNNDFTLQKPFILWDKCRGPIQ